MGLAEFACFAELPAGSYTVHYGHHYVHQDDVRLEGVCYLNGFFAIFGLCYTVAFTRQVVVE